MILIVCLDDKNGMMFNKRRQSRDAAVIADIVAQADGSILWMNSYSAKLFGTGVRIDEDFLDKASQGEYCFVEGQDVSQVIDRVERIILYKWNRMYPSDVRFEMAMDGWKLDEIRDFKGNSHEKITKEVYIK